MSIQEQADALWCGEKFMLGPMVRANSAALRWACLHFGADAVYSEELIAQRVSNCQRETNPTLETVDFIRRVPSKERRASGVDVVFRTHERHEVATRRCILQLGASDAVSALRAAHVLEKDVAAIDVNMGCAKHYAVSAGMGAQLMTDQRVAEDIVKTLRRNLSIPISVKTRVFTSSATVTGGCGDRGAVDVHRTCDWMQVLQKAGASAIAVHGRSMGEKTFDAPHDDVYSLLYHSLAGTNTHLVCNGDIFTYDDVARIRRSVFGEGEGEGENTKALRGRAGLSFMMARPALWNPSIFRNFKVERRRRQSTCVSSELDGHAGEFSAPITRDFGIQSRDFRSCAESGEEAQESETDVSAYVDEDATFSTSDLLGVITRMSALSANCIFNTKYLLQHLLAGARLLHSPARTAILSANSLLDISAITKCESFVAHERMRQQAAWPATLQACSGTTGANFAQGWPGLVSSTCHTYQHSYFDDNYYTAFRRVTALSRSATGGEAVADEPLKCSLGGGPAALSGTAASRAAAVCDVHSRKFKYSAFSGENTTVVTTTKKKQVKQSR